MVRLAAVLVVLLGTQAAQALEAPTAEEFLSGGERTVLESPRTSALELKLGGYRPRVERESGVTGNPFQDVFGEGSMLLAQLEYERFLYQGVGTLGVAFALGYAEKYGPARAVDTGAPAGRTGFKVLPMHLHAVYKFDYPAFRWGIPLVPYAQGGLHYIPWWVTEGEGIEDVEGLEARGGKWGYGGTLGVQFLLDVLEPRFARDFDGDMGVNHSYFFAEFTYANVDNFGGSGLDLSSRHLMFGLALDF